MTRCLALPRCGGAVVSNQDSVSDHEVFLFQYGKSDNKPRNTYGNNASKKKKKKKKKKGEIVINSKRK